MKKEAYKNTTAFERDYWWYQGRHQIITTLVKELCLKSSSPAPALLDVGCGTGFILEAISNHANAYGIDKEFQSPEYISDAVRQKIAVATLPGIPMKENIFEGILALDVIEHLEDDKIGLEILKKHLKPGGFLFLTVPAFNFLWSGEDYVSEHKRRYTAKTLETLLLKTGYRIERISYFNTVLFIPVVLAVLAKRLFSPQDMYRSNLQPLPVLLNRALSALFKSEAEWLKSGNFPIGASLLGVARA